MAEHVAAPTEPEIIAEIACAISETFEELAADMWLNTEPGGTAYRMAERAVAIYKERSRWHVEGHTQ